MSKPIDAPLCECGNCQAALDRALAIFQELRKEHHCDVWFTGVATGIEVLMQNSYVHEPALLVVTAVAAEAMTTEAALDYLNQQMAAIDGALREPRN